MKSLQRVVWSEGMLMSPHHLQQQDLYHEGLLEGRIRALAPHAWGIVRIEADARALESAQIVVRELELVMPTGALVRVGPEDTDALPARSFEGHFPPGAQALPVFVGLPRERPEAAALEDENTPQGTRRYRAQSRRVFDRNLGASPLEVDFATPNLRILFGDERIEDYECVPILEVVRDGSGALAFSDTFIPPSLQVGASPFLRNGLARMLSLAVSRRRVLSEQQRQRDAASVEFHASDVTRYLQLHAINGAIPPLKYAVEAAHVSPLFAYHFLTQWAGQLCTFALEVDPGKLPEYQHGALRDTFEPLFAILTRLMRETMTGRCISVPLEVREDGMHLAKLGPEELLRNGVRFYLSVASNLAESQVQQAVPRIAKVGCWGEITQLVSSATTGVPLRSEARPAKELPVRSGCTYFSLDATDSRFRGVLRERTIAVHLPPPFDVAQTQVLLLAVPPEE